jgi:glutamyl-tRNA reductase
MIIRVRSLSVALGWLLVTACGEAAFADTIYKSTDAEGNVVYSDRPATANAQPTDIKVDRPDPKEVARNVRDQQILEAEDLQRKNQQSAAERKAAQVEHEKQVQCEAARNRYYILKDARRLFERDADGNRVYYSDVDANAKREEARQVMAAVCGT